MPRSGLPYELFDAAWLVLGLALLWYVTTTPSATTADALSDTLSMILEPRAWGWAMAIAAATAVLLSYGTHRCVLVGYILLGAVTVGWAVSLAVGVVATLPPRQVAGKTLGVALVYGWATSRVVRNVLRESATSGTATKASGE